MQVAATVARHFDDCAGWKWNEGKGQMWGTDAEQREVLKTVTPPIGDIGTSVTILGVTVDVARRAAGQGYEILREAAAGKAMRQCKRIRQACPIGAYRSRTRRAKLVAQLIIPKMCWGGQWQRPDRGIVKKRGH